MLLLLFKSSVWFTHVVRSNHLTEKKKKKKPKNLKIKTTFFPLFSYEKTVIKLIIF